MTSRAKSAVGLLGSVELALGASIEGQGLSMLQGEVALEEEAMPEAEGLPMNP